MTDPKLTWTIANATLRNLYPPSAVVHVGAGQGIGKIHAWRDWDVQLGLCIEADASRTMAWQGRSSPDALGRIRVIHAIAGPNDGPAVFHRASNPAEDSLVEPQVLNALWPQLKCLESRSVETRSIDSIVYSEVDEGGVQNAWLIVDCFPVDTLLQGARALLQRTDVVVVRARTDEDAQFALDLLRVSGFTAFGSVEANHPGVQHLLWVRSPAELKNQRQQSVEALDAECEAFGRERVQLQRELESMDENNRQLIAERDSAGCEHLATVASAVTRTEALENALAVAERRGQQLLEERDAHSTLAAERQAALASLDQTLASTRLELAAEQAARQDAQVQRDQESQAKSASVAEAQALMAQLEAFQNDLTDLRNRLQELEAERNEATRRGQTWLAERDAHATLAAERQGIIASLEQAVASAQAALASEHRATQDMLGQRDKERQAKSASASEAEALKAQLDALQKDFQALRAQLQEREAERDEAARRGQAWLAERDAHATLAAERQGIIASLDQARAAAEAALASEQRATQHMLVQRDQEGQAKSASLAEAEALKTQLDALQNDFHALRAQLQEREAERDEAARRGQAWLAERDAHATLAAERQGVIASLDQARAAAETALASELRARKHALVQRDQESQAKSASVAEAEALRAQVGALQNDLQTLRTRLQEREADRDAHAALAAERQGTIASLQEALASAESTLVSVQLAKNDATSKLDHEVAAKQQSVKSSEMLSIRLKTTDEELAQLRTRLQHLEAEREDADTRGKTLLAERDASAKISAELQVLTSSLKQALAATEQNLKTQEEQNRKDFHTFREQLQDGQTQREALLHVQRDIVASLRNEGQAKLEALKERDLIRQELENTRARVAQQKAENQDTVDRQQLMHHELVKAEAQIELIKDLLLGDADI
jgi:hypothetical protein